MNIEKLPNWVVLRSRYAFEDTESNTAIEQTARLYQAIQEIITACSEFSKTINSQFDEFTLKTSEDYEKDIETLNKIMHEFIHSVDTKVDESVNFMKDNLNESVKSTINEMKETGELNEVLDVLVGDIEGRVTTLENTEYSLVHDTNTETLTLVKNVIGGGE